MEARDPGVPRNSTELAAAAIAPRYRYLNPETCYRHAAAAARADAHAAARRRSIITHLLALPGQPGYPAPAFRRV